MNFRRTTIAEIASPEARSIAIGPFGSSLKADMYTHTGVPVVRGQNLTDSKEIDLSDVVYVAPETASKFPACLLEKGDLVFPHRGAIGRVGLVGATQALLSSSMMKLKCDPSKADSRFVLYYFRGPGRRELMMRASTVGTPGIGQPLTSLREIPIALPPIDEQRAIAEVLGALDDKIAVNTEVVQTIESLTHAIYTRGLSGYETAPLSATADFVNGKAFTKGASGTGRVVVRIAELNSGLGGSTVYSDAEVEEKHVARPGDILFAWSGSLTLSRWYRDDAIVNQHIFKVIPKAGYPSWLVYQLIRSKLAGFKSIAADKATTMGHIQRHHLDEHVAIPGPEEIARMDAVMSPLWQHGLVAEQESPTLAELRDTLLPELMSGRLRVKDAEKKIEEVV